MFSSWLKNSTDAYAYAGLESNCRSIHHQAFAVMPVTLRCTQVNVWVGPFFVLSGYVAAYTATEIGKFEASPRIKPASAYSISRIAGYYPLYILVQILFAAMFAFADNAYNGPIATIAHGIMSCTLVQVSFLAWWIPGTCVFCCICM